MATPRKPKRLHKKDGRPTKFLPAYATVVSRLARLGATDDEMAEALGVSRSTLNRWKDADPKFRDAIRDGKVEADAAISESLYRRGQEYEYVEEQAIKVKDVRYADGKRTSETERVEIVEVTKRVPPDTSSMIFWLKNRRPKEWRDKQEVEHSGTVGIADAIAAARDRAKRR